MTMEMSGTYESYHNRKKLKNEVVGKHNDVEIFNKLNTDAQNASRQARAQLAAEHPDVLTLLERIENDDAGRQEIQLFRSYKESGDTDIPRLINAAFLPGLVSMLKDDIASYISTIHKAEGFKQANPGLKETEVLDELENLDHARSSAHDTLIRQLQAVARAAQTAGIDISWINVIELDIGSIEKTGRERVQQWAERVADYFAHLPSQERRNA